MPPEGPRGIPAEAPVRLAHAPAERDAAACDGAGQGIAEGSAGLGIASGAPRRAAARAGEAA